MNTPTELIQLREFLWSQAQYAGQVDQSVSAFKSVAGEIAFGFLLPLSAAMFLFLVAAFFYQPRLMRGALWVPAFGLFGSVPKLYFHTRPASFLGVFLSSRRRKKDARVYRKTTRSD
ncbi:MAG: hypothetical protein O2960_24045 [Verrucomicrobia bacterium]|nr:hypothetical protein [Verrucomicrobiota bacterium]